MGAADRPRRGRKVNMKQRVEEETTLGKVARFDTIRTVLALTAQYKWKVFQLDVKFAFLNNFLDNEIYVKQPQGYEIKDMKNKVYRLKKALYALKQAPRAWYSRIDAHFLQNGFSRIESEPTLYVKTQGTEVLIVCLYVDGLIYIGNSQKMIGEFKSHMVREFEMMDLNLMNYFWDCNSVAKPIGTNLKLSVNDGAKKVDANNYISLIGSLLYVTHTRPNILFSTSLLSRFMQNPSKIYLGAAKQILRYLKGTVAMDYGSLTLTFFLVLVF
uniref:Reverse transcriptase Ty1/copia-type domain-containing protein n=1 Tax=Ananas comosus var. bracteatus TaxID=296719 RepID=A0A6V7Q2Q5_ANACO|nr:unnamed protein product [Ananas comosus var. bracteatus]